MIAEALFIAAGIYVLRGIVFAIPFVLVGVGKVDPHAARGTWGFRVLIVPGTMFLWPLLARRWMTGIHEPPEEKNPHRCAARNHGGSRLDEALASTSEIRSPKCEMSQSLVTSAAADEGYADVCAVADILEKRARIICLSGERVAVFKFDGKVSAVSNVCQHQNGPLGEGRILDGCITCPWHGYQYLPDTGASPPPFVEKVPTFNVRLKNGRVLVHPKPNPTGKRAEPALIEPQPRTSRGEEAPASRQNK